MQNLLNRWLELKNIEDDAKAERVSIEQQIVSGIGMHNGESSKTHNIEEFKVVVKPNIYRKMDVEGAKDVLETIPEELRPVKLVVWDTGLKWLEDNEPKLYRQLVKWITITPGKTTVTVTRKE